MSFLQSLKEAAVTATSMLVENDGASSPAPAPAAKPTLTPTPLSTPVSSWSSSVGIVAPATVPMGTTPLPDSNALDSNSDLYLRLKAATDFDETPVGKLLHKFLDPLQKISGDEKMKLTTALELGADAGLTGEKILSTLGELKDRLATEITAAGKAAEEARAREVAGRQTRLDGLKQEIEALQQQITEKMTETSTVSSEMFNWESKIAQGEARFKTAHTTRQLELESTSAKYQALVQN
jgi:hypothetical protein